MTLYEQNDAKVTKSILKILKYLLLVFPVLFVLGKIGFFKYTMAELAKITIIAVVAIVSPYICNALHMPIRYLKYIAVMSVQVTACVMGTNHYIGIYMTYAAGMLISIFYYDKKFTRNIAIISYALIVASIYFRELSGAYWISWQPTSVGYLIETVVVFALCSSIAGSGHELLVTYAKAQDTGEKLGTFSKEIADKVFDSEELINDFSSSSEDMQQRVERSSSSSDSVKQNMDIMQQTIMDSVNSLETLNEGTKRMLDTTHSISDEMNQYMNTLNELETEINLVNTSVSDTSKQIELLEASVLEIEKEVSSIASIANKTHLLSLNANVEAARAGAAGKGFAVVAEEVGVLSKNTNDASSRITDNVESIRKHLLSVQKSNNDNIERMHNSITALKNTIQNANTIKALTDNEYNEMNEVTSLCAVVTSNSQQLTNISTNTQSITHTLSEDMSEMRNAIIKQNEVTSTINDTFASLDDIAKTLSTLSKDIN